VGLGTHCQLVLKAARDSSTHAWHAEVLADMRRGDDVILFERYDPRHSPLPRNMDSGRQVRLNSGLPWNGNEIGEGLTRPVCGQQLFSRQHHYPRALPLTLADEIVALEKADNAEDGRFV